MTLLLCTHLRIPQDIEGHCNDHNPNSSDVHRANDVFSIVKSFHIDVACTKCQQQCNQLKDSFIAIENSNEYFLNWIVEKVDEVISGHTQILKRK